MSADKKWNSGADAADDDDDDSRDETEFQAMKDATLFAIEISNSMIAPADEDDDDVAGGSKKKKNKKPRYSSAEAALRCAEAILKNRIISTPNDMMGILLFGTEQTKYGEGSSNISYPNCYLLMDLDIPDAPSIKELKYLLDNPDELSEILKPSKKPASMANVLFAANHLFTTKAANFNSRRLFIITDNDNPETDKSARASAQTRARDLYDLGVRIEPFFVSSPTHQFDKTLFYTDIMYDTGEDTTENLPDAEEVAKATDAESRYEQMLSAITAKQAPRRALFTLKMEIGKGFVIGIKGYLLHKRVTPSRSHYIHEQGEKLQIVKGTTTRMDEETAQEVTPDQIRKAYKFGGETVSFSDEEFKKIRNFGDPVLRILGFKPQTELQFWHNMRSSTFIYPSEEDYTGSTRTFAALRNKLLKDKLMGIAWFIARRNAAPVMAAIIPSEEPQGMFIIPLPFVDDIRQNPEVPHVVAPNYLIDRMQDIIRQLHMPKGYIPEKYPNPALQKHYKVLEAIALEEELPEEFEDKTEPKYKNIEKHAGQYIQDWGDALSQAMAEFRLTKPAQVEIHGTKRGREPAGAAAAKKVKKDVDSGPGDADKEMRAAYDKNTLSKLTVAVLKDWLNSKGMSVAGKKADLVERIEEHFENK
ncbi:ATP-dependent DNA helicase II subunit 1 [Orbilia oligospora]|uniref:ATP-dependent DNA helicase II subunit 1 n=1 Tax=Orbilia oligospora TaxID=2813651 RepID=A0A7C8R7A4_ORBOL|nr:ATP-dependent DNA helicase II subunit 1 [Orbilia oligospora]